MLFSQNRVLPRIFIIFLEQRWFGDPKISIAQEKISVVQISLTTEIFLEQCWSFLEQRWFDGLKISVTQGKCRKNSVAQIFLKLNAISVASRTALLKVALLKDPLTWILQSLQNFGKNNSCYFYFILYMLFISELGSTTHQGWRVLFLMLEVPK